jgi:hypothetical protein
MKGIVSPNDMFFKAYNKKGTFCTRADSFFLFDPKAAILTLKMLTGSRL